MLAYVDNNVVLYLTRRVNLNLRAAENCLYFLSEIVVEQGIYERVHFRIE